MARFEVSQRVQVVDKGSPHHGSVARVIVVTPEQDRFFYWLRFELNPTGGRFNEEQLQTVA